MDKLIVFIYLGLCVLRIHIYTDTPGGRVCWSPAPPRAHTRSFISQDIDRPPPLALSVDVIAVASIKLWLHRPTTSG